MDTRNNNGNTAINAASYRGYNKCVECLISADASLNMCNNRQQTPLINAAMNGSYGVIRT